MCRIGRILNSDDKAMLHGRRTFLKIFQNDLKEDGPRYSAPIPMHQNGAQTALVYALKIWKKIIVAILILNYLHYWPWWDFVCQYCEVGHIVPLF